MLFYAPNPDLPFLAFMDFLVFSLQGILGFFGSVERRVLLLDGSFSFFFLSPKKQGKKIRELAPKSVNIASLLFLGAPNMSFYEGKTCGTGTMSRAPPPFTSPPF